MAKYKVLIWDIFDLKTPNTAPLKKEITGSRAGLQSTPSFLKAFPDCAGKILKERWQKWQKRAQKVLKISK